MPDRPRIIIQGVSSLLLVLAFAGGPAVLWAQTPLDQKVSYRGRQLNLPQHLDQLRQQFQLSFTYSSDELDLRRKVSLRIRRRPLRQLLDKLSQTYQFSYRQIGGQVVLRPLSPPSKISRRPEKTEEARPGPPLLQTIRGTIVDARTQQALIGANIYLLESETFHGASTDEEGRFVLNKVPVGRQNLEVSYIGYEPYQITGLKIISGKENQLRIELQESTNVLSEVVVKARIDKMSPLNQMASISARTFSVEETSRYAASFLDPGRDGPIFSGRNFHR